MATLQATTTFPRKAKTGGRRAGVPNKVTREFRQTVADLLDANTDNVAAWLAAVAEGDPAAGRPPDPARALDLIVKLAEYAVPKMTRVVAVDQGSSAANVASIEIEFIDAPPRAALASDLVMQFPASPLRN